jgi:transposase
MMFLPHAVRVFVVLDPVDMRKSHYGLSGALERLGLDPVSGHLFLFFNKGRNLCKILFFERNGLAIWFNHLASHYTSFGLRLTV